MNKIKCPHCGAENDFDAVHCKKCGAFVDRPSFNARQEKSLMETDYSDVLNKHKVSIIIIAGLAIASALALYFGRDFFFGYWENISSDFPAIFANTFALWLAAILLVFVGQIFMIPIALTGSINIPGFVSGLLKTILVLVVLGGTVGFWALLSNHLSNAGFFQILFSLVLGASLSFTALLIPIASYFEDVTTKGTIKCLIISLLLILLVIFLCLTGCWLFNHQNAGLAFLMIVLGLIVMGAVSGLQFVFIF